MKPYLIWVLDVIVAFVVFKVTHDKGLAFAWLAGGFLVGVAAMVMFR